MFKVGDKNYKYQTFLTASAKSIPSVNKEVKSKLAIASISSLTGIFDKEVLETIKNNPDLIYIASNLVLANHANLNNDCIRTEDLYKVAKLFEYKQINTEHQRSSVVGFLDETGWSLYPSNELIDSDKIFEQESPVQLVVGGIVWRVVDNELANLIEESSNENSPQYQSLSLSFEVLFDYYDIAVGPDRNLKNANVYKEGSVEWSKYNKILPQNGGNGREGNNIVYRVLSGSLLPVGAGIVKNPASGLKGIAVVNEDSPLEDEEDEGEKEQAVATVSENIIKNENTCVTISKPIIMLTKIADLKDQWDDFKKLEAVAAVDSIQKTFEALVLEKSTEWAAKIAEKEEAAKAAVAKQEEVAKRAESLSQAVAELTKKLEDIELAEKQKTAEANFNARMGALDETFDLDDEDRSFLVEEVRSLDTEAAFAAWFDKKKKLMKEKTKAYKSNKAKCMKEEMAKAGVTVVIDEKTLDMTEVVASLKQDKQELPPVSTEPARDLKASMQKAFAEGIEIRKL
jgi:hypothetical protein